MKSDDQLMCQLKESFPADLDYNISLDTTLAVHRGNQRDRQDFCRLKP